MIKTLDIRGCCTDQELTALPEFHDTKFDIELILDELTDAYEIIGMDFHRDDKPDDIRSMYFPLGTQVYQPGMKVKSRVLPSLVAKGLKALKERGILNDDMLEGVSRDKLVVFYNAIHKHVMENKNLNADEAFRILNRVKNDSP